MHCLTRRLIKTLSEPDRIGNISLMHRFVSNMWPAAVWLAGIFLLTLLPGNYFPSVSGFWSAFSPDKLVHIAMFSGLAFLLAFGLKRQYPERSVRCIFMWVLVVSTFIAILTEFLQWYLPVKRDGNIYDAIADIVGIFIGFAVFFLLKNKIARK